MNVLTTLRAIPGLGAFLFVTSCVVVAWWEERA